MTVREFDGFIFGARVVFGRMLKKEKCTTGHMKRFFKRLLDRCTNDFEEDTLKENLQEIFRDYLEEVKVA